MQNRFNRVFEMHILAVFLCFAQSIAVSCNKLTIDPSVGDVTIFNKKISQYERWCYRGSALDCFAAGLLYEQGSDQTEKNIEFSCFYYKKGCLEIGPLDYAEIYGKRITCVQLVKTCVESEENEFKIAIEMVGPQCTVFKDVRSCIAMAILLGNREDFNEATRYSEYACEYGDCKICFLLGATELAYREETPEKEKYIKDHLQNACNCGEQKGCFFLQTLNEVGIESMDREKIKTEIDKIYDED